MSLTVLKSRAQLGIEAPLVSIEVHLSNGLLGPSIVGLPEEAELSLSGELRKIKNLLCQYKMIKILVWLRQFKPIALIA